MSSGTSWPAASASGVAVASTSGTTPSPSIGLPSAEVRFQVGIAIVAWLASLVLRLAGRHTVLAVEIRDPREQELADVGELRLVDPETGRQLRVDTGDRALRERFAAAAADERRTLVGMLASAGVRHVALSTDGDWLRPLAGFLRQRRRGR